MSKYHRLKITASDDRTDIWLSDDEGNFIQKEKGTMVTHLLPGWCAVHFGLHTPKFSFNLDRDLELTQTELESK